MVKPFYGQVVVGPPGSGKTTYCDGMQQYLRLLGRNCLVVNLDPANEMLRYETVFDVCEDVIEASSVMNELHLGPNGALLYCMEYLDQHAEDWMETLMSRLQNENVYLLLDLPGQSEVYTHGSVASMLQKLSKRMDARWCAVQLLDSTSCSDAYQFISTVLLGTTTMLRLELPTINVLSKMDLMLSSNTAAFSPEFFLHCHDLHRLLDHLDAPVSSALQDDNEFGDDKDYWDDEEFVRARQKRSWFRRKHHKLCSLLVEVVEDFGLFGGLLPLDVQNPSCMGHIIMAIDKANGYVFLANNNNNNNNQDLLQCAMTSHDGDDDLHQQLTDMEQHLIQRQQQEQGGRTKKT